MYPHIIEVKRVYDVIVELVQNVGLSPCQRREPVVVYSVSENLEAVVRKKQTNLVFESTGFVFLSQEHKNLSVLTHYSPLMSSHDTQITSSRYRDLQFAVSHDKSF